MRQLGFRQLNTVVRVAIGLLLGSVAPFLAGAQDNPLYGIWEGGDNATLAVYGSLKITPTAIYRSTNRRDWTCETPYTVLESGTSSHWSTGGTVRYWKLLLERPDCWQHRSMVFAIPTVVKTLDYIDYVELEGDQREGDGHLFRTQEANRLADSDPLNIPGTTFEDKMRFLSDVPNDDPNLKELYQRALESPSPGFRSLVVQGIRRVGPQSAAIAILMRLIADDPAAVVREKAGDELNCMFVCGGASHDSADVSAFEAEMSLVIKTMTAPDVGHYVKEVTDVVWCELSESGRARLAPAVAAFYPYRADDLLRPEVYDAICSKTEESSE